MEERKFATHVLTDSLTHVLTDPTSRAPGCASTAGAKNNSQNENVLRNENKKGGQHEYEDSP